MTLLFFAKTKLLTLFNIAIINRLIKWTKYEKELFSIISRSSHGALFCGVFYTTFIKYPGI